jgi:hypothetical protein
LAAAFGLRWQSAAATALSQGESVGYLFPKRRRAPLAAAVQNVLSANAILKTPPTVSTSQFNCGGRGAKILKEKPSAVTLPLVTEK